MPAIVVSTGLVVGGVGNIAAGIQGLSQALMSQGSGSPGPQGMAPVTKGGSRPLTAGRLMDHHIFPQQFRKFFERRGIDIDKFTIRVGETTHLKGIHGRGLGDMPGRWNARWAEFIDANPKATAKDIYQLGGRLMDE